MYSSFEYGLESIDFSLVKGQEIQEVGTATLLLKSDVEDCGLYVGEKASTDENRCEIRIYEFINKPPIFYALCQFLYQCKLERNVHSG